MTRDRQTPEPQTWCGSCGVDPADERHDKVQSFLLGVCVTLVVIVLLGLAGVLR